MTPRYDLLIEPPAHQQRKRLPGNVRQRIKRAIGDLAQDRRPHNSQELDTSDLDLPPEIEIRRI